MITRSASKYAFPDRDAGGYAPQPFPRCPHQPQGFTARAAAHSSSLPLACVAGILLAAAVTVLCSAAQVALRPVSSPQFGGVPPVPRALPAYSGSAGSEAVVRRVTSGVREMSRGLRLSDLHSAGVSVHAMNMLFHPERIEERSAPAPEPTPLAGEDLTLLQQVALLRMMNATLARGVAGKIIDRAGCQAKPSIVDYHELSTRGFCIRHSGEQYHEITAEGMNTGRRLLARLCAELDIHVMQEQRHGDNTTYRCSCGGWSKSFRGNGQFTWRRAANTFHAHYNPFSPARQAKQADCEGA